MDVLSSEALLAAAQQDEKALLLANAKYQEVVSEDWSIQWIWMLPAVSTCGDKSHAQLSVIKSYQVCPGT